VSPAGDREQAKATGVESVLVIRAGGWIMRWRRWLEERSWRPACVRRGRGRRCSSRSATRRACCSTRPAAVRRTSKARCGSSWNFCTDSSRWRSIGRVSRCSDRRASNRGTSTTIWPGALDGCWRRPGLR
jgi:hypothetical protein